MKRLLSIAIIFVSAFVIGYISTLPFLKWAPVPEIADSYSNPPLVASWNYHPDQPTFTDVEYDPDRVVNRRSKRLVWPSQFHSEFFPYKNKSSWFGLFKEGQHYVVRRAKLQVFKIRDPELYDLDVKTESQDPTLFLLRNLPAIRESVVLTVFDGVTEADKQLPLNSDSQTLSFNGVDYILSIHNPVGEEYLTKGSALVLSVNGKSQTIRYLNNGCNDCSWELLWAGDLDRDGKLDFWMDLSSHYNITDRVLFLSKPAGPGKLVKHVANFYSVGC